ncbi:hypothetical protein KY284_011616 [Solanum tuberosum]|nr:hypothetical protein KY284_011616 [Solanum tuberosum]
MNVLLSHSNVSIKIHMKHTCEARAPKLIYHFTPAVFYFAVGDNRRGCFLKVFYFAVGDKRRERFLKVSSFRQHQNCYYNNTMTSLEELENQCLPISKLKKYATEWVIKVLVIRRSLTKEYKNANGEGIRWQLILVDEEGTKIQTTLFNKDVHAWNKSFQLNQSYYIINGKLNGAKPNFLSVHKDLELAFMNNTDVVEDKSQFKTEQFSNGFISFDKAKKITNGSLFVKALTGEGQSIRREVIITNERYDRKVMTLWGDFAQIEGQMLQSLESDKPVLAFCDVKSSIYQGDFVLSTTPVSSLLINPQFEKANNLQEWNDNMKAQKIDLSLMPSRLMQTARQVKITNILNGSLAIVKDMYYKFNATVSGIDNNTDPWYHACKKCYRRVTVINSNATCTYCRTEDIDYAARYRLKIDVTDEDQFLRITLFDAAKYFLGCDVKDYVLSTSEKITAKLHMLDQTRQEKCHTNNPKFVPIKSTMTHNQHQGDKGKNIPSTSKFDQHDNHIKNELSNTGTVAYNLSLSYLHVLKTVPECNYCAAKRLEHEPPTFCCASGYIKLATTEAPTELYEMFVASTPDAVEFRKNIRAYDSIFAFTSFGVNLDKELASARN